MGRKAGGGLSKSLMAWSRQWADDRTAEVGGELSKELPKLDLSRLSYS
jgi:hypothetical protein